MREVFVSELAKEVLGPRGGPHEVLTESPLGEYITGVLAPDTSATTSANPDLDADAVLPSDDEDGGEDSLVGDEDVGSLSVPVLNPQDRPRSMGISFVVAQDTGRDSSAATTPALALDVCVTWARYERRGADSHSTAWTRLPRSAVLRGTTIRTQAVWLDGAGHRVPAGDLRAEVSLHVITPQGATAGQVIVSLYLVNRVRVPAGGFPSAELHVFQPQLRIVAATGTAIVPGIEGEPHSDEERELRFLYLNRPVLARGHLCSATWRAIDPERVAEGELRVDSAEHAQSIPFVWVDRDVVPAADAATFSRPDVRTEFVPTYPVQAPDFDLPGDGPAPLLEAARLAECWDPAILHDALAPIADRYDAWVTALEQDANAIANPDDRTIAQRLAARCRDAATRIAGGIALLERDDEVRLAFCFAMQAVALQYGWPATRALVWRPFQLGFILLTLESIANPKSADREVADLLWVSTGGGKTEAYLALAAFAMAYRRRRALTRVAGPAVDRTGAGVAVITRYTLRLLTIQQFRRTLKLVTACECLRVHGLGARSPLGWRPAGYNGTEDFLWGSTRFSAGLWVGGDVTPNQLDNSFVPGALALLERAVAGTGEPAQVIRCPACDGVLSVPQREEGGLPAGTYDLHLVLRGPVISTVPLLQLTSGALRVTGVATAAGSATTTILTLSITANSAIVAEDVDRLWAAAETQLTGASLIAARASRPGYFFRTYLSRRGPKRFDFDILCPNPECALVRNWCEGAPAGNNHDIPAGATGPRGGRDGIPALPDGNRLCHVSGAFRGATPFISSRVPIPACTVDEQVYARCPSIVLATVDKFARPAYEPRAATLFGNVGFHHCMYGYYRPFQTFQQTDSNGHPSPSGGRGAPHCVQVTPLDPPDLILQDELHLIEGPLGSLVGIYETAVDELTRGIRGWPVKYVASTATVRQAEEQVQSVFGRPLATFPPPGLSADNSFFVRHRETHPLDDARAGRLYVGLCAPGRGPLTPLVRVWAMLLQSVWAERQLRGDVSELDPYWTLTGYFNAVRELAGARALYRQDIPERLRHLAGVAARPVPDERSQELSGRMSSTELPVVLDLLNHRFGQDALFTTAMFGTGVDVPRLGLMVVNGQPKTTSAYIQATGRVGRAGGALVGVFLRATRPRDLNHYEFFCGYHAQLHRFVEPVTVMPFAPGSLERAAGPVGVFVLRNQHSNGVAWDQNTDARRMRTQRSGNSAVNALPGLFENRALGQPAARRPAPGVVAALVARGLNEWQRVATVNPHTLRFVEYSIASPPTVPVVLGDAAHQHAQLDVVYANAPSSLRDIEETCGFET